MTSSHNQRCSCRLIPCPNTCKTACRCKDYVAHTSSTRNNFTISLLLLTICTVLVHTPSAAADNVISCPGKLRSVYRSDRRETPQRKNGVWVRDPYQETDRIYFMGYEPLETRQMWEFETLNDLAQSGKPLTFYQMNDRVDGTGLVVYDRNMYFNIEGTKKVARFDLSTQRVESTVILHSANYHDTSPYSIDLQTDIDLAVDENGLWVIYATEKNFGNIVISRLDHHTLRVVKTWETKYDKISALNTFMICGVMYAVNAETLKIDYMYNTTANEGTTDISISMPYITNKTSSIEYNPKDRQLYVWDQGAAINYKLRFEAIVPIPPPITTTTSKPTTTTTTSKTPKTTTTQPKPPHPSGAKCKGISMDGIYWEDTPYGTTAKRNCPGTTSAQAIWLCGGNTSVPQWVTKNPDFSPCTSDWIRIIEQRLHAYEEGSVSDLSLEFLNQLRYHIDKPEPQISSWDITKSATLLEGFLNRSTKEESQHAAQVTDNIMESISLLLRPNITGKWIALGAVLQNKIAGNLISTLEDSAFFLSYDMSDDQTGDSEDQSMSLKHELTTLGIRVEPIDHNPGEDVTNRYQSIRWRSGQDDSVKVHTSAVVEAISDFSTNQLPANNNQTTRHLSIVLLSFRNLGTYMKDSELYTKYRNPINSRIISVSVATIDKTLTGDNMLSAAAAGKPPQDVVVNKHHPIHFSKPVTFTMKHITSNLLHHVCVYWKYLGNTGMGQWSRRGCRRVSGNYTHSTCECNHMTSFTVLSSNKTFPPMDSDMPPPTSVVPIPSNIDKDLPIIRTGLGASILCLLIVAITLIAVGSIQSDTNTIHKNLVLSLIFTEVVFIAGIDFTAKPVLCGAVAALLHYGLLAAFTWAALEAFHLMITINEVTERRDRWRWFYAVGYGIPAIVVATSAAVDHDGYGTGVVCWLKTDGLFIWSFIGPCCFIIALCVVFLAATMYKLHLHAVNFTVEAPKNKNIRAGVARSCVLMFLLCLLWSCGVLWLSKFQPRATAILFSVLLVIHGMTTLVLYCILSSEIRRRYRKCFHCQRKSHDPARHPSRVPMMAHDARHPSSSSVQASTLRPNETMQYPGYRYTLGSSGCPEYRTTLVPESYARNMNMSKAADVMAQRAASEMELTRITNVSSEPRYSVRGHSDGSAMDITDNTVPKGPVNHTMPDPRMIHVASNGQYIPPASTAIAYTAHHYEQPLPHFSTMSSAASGAYNHLHEDYPSGSHHHAHDHCMHQLQGGRRHHYETLSTPCPDCSSNNSSAGVEPHRPQAVHYKHRYEDVQPLTVCVAQARSDVQCASYPCFDNASQPYRVATSSNGDLANAEVRVMGGSNNGKGRSCRTMPGSKTVVNPNNYNLNQKMSPSTNSFPQNQVYMANGGVPRHHSNIVMGTTALSTGNSPANGNVIAQPPLRRPRNGSYTMSKTGRASDPLSTDQGYDTDSQIPQCKNCGGNHFEADCSNSSNHIPHIKQPLIVRSAKPTSEGILHPGSTGKRLLPPSPATSSSSSNAKPEPERKIKTRQPRKRGSTSDLSDCTSENDREVEMIYTSANGSSNSSPAAHGDSGAFDEDEEIEHMQSYNSQAHRLQNEMLVEPPAAFCQSSSQIYNRSQHGDDLPEDLIDVERGGRMSVAESVTSWCGQSGSNPRAVNPSYGRQKSSKKSTNDPQIILANARKSHSHHKGSNQQLNNHNDSSSNRQDTTHNGYTLRGSTEAGTKARVDLKAGSISMVTNL